MLLYFTQIRINRFVYRFKFVKAYDAEIQKLVGKYNEKSKFILSMLKY